jgi:D-lyxose ketol-isomerase
MIKRNKNRDVNKKTIMYIEKILHISKNNIDTNIYHIIDEETFFNV